jgi:hypothetical protein
MKDEFDKIRNIIAVAAASASEDQIERDRIVVAATAALSIAEQIVADVHRIADALTMIASPRP